MQKTNKIVWEAYDHIDEPKSADWYWTISIITAGAVILSTYFGNILLSILLIISVMILFVQSKNPPRIINFEINRKGLSAGEILYPYQTLESFYIIDEDGYERDRLILKSKKTFMPYIVMPIGKVADHDEIREYLLDYLDEEALTESSLYKSMKNLGF